MASILIRGRAAGRDSSRPVSRWTRVAMVVPIVVGLGYAGMTACLVAPPSPAQVRLDGAAKALAHPLFEQNWQLFAPEPPDSNTDGWYQVAYLDESGNRRESEPRSLTGPFLDQSQSQWWFPNRVDRVATTMGHNLANLQDRQKELDKLSAPGSESPPPATPSLAPTEHRRPSARQKALDIEVAQEAIDVRRVLSPLADHLTLPGRVVEVRAFFTTTPTTRFSDRYADHPPDGKPVRVGDSNWVAYLPEEDR